MDSFPTDFTHLCVHSHYSLLGATASVSELAAQAKRDGFTRLALTDANALYGAIAFNRACLKAGIQPIIGMTADVAIPPGEMPPDGLDAPGRLVLLAADEQGYRSLCRLSSLYQSDPERVRRRIGLNWDELKAHREGLICLSGGRADWLERYLRQGNVKVAARYIARLAALYGENCFLGVGPSLIEADRRGSAAGIVAEIISQGRRFGVEAAALHPTHVLQPEQLPLLRLMAAIDCNCRVDETPETALPALGDPEVLVHWLGPAEIAAHYEPYPELPAAAGRIAAGCQPALPDGRPIWPSLPLENGLAPEAVMRSRAEAGLRERYGDEILPAVAERLAHELAVITGYGYAPLFLVVADIVRFARSAAIPVSTRGSVANSLAAYCLGITAVDPIRHDLLFERFLNPARRSLPDIDLDFCSRRRDEVLDYVRRTYGPERVALVATVSTLQGRSAVRETAKALGLADDRCERLLALLPHGWHPDPRRRDNRAISDIIPKLDDELSAEVIRRAEALINQPHHLSIHPGGIVITPGPLTDTLPVQLAPKGFLITQFAHEDVEEIGLPKLDLLGIRALTVMADAAELVRRFRDPDFRLEELPPEDERTGDILSRGEAIGVFQCESEGAQRTLRQLRARNVEDLAVAGAFFKPGPAMGGMARTFVARYRGQEPVAFLHPALEPILGRTKGVLLFQEQVLRIAREIAGLSWQQADRLRRGMSKFQAEEMAALAADFVAGCCRPAPEGPGFSREQAERLWDQIIPFAGYGFNQGHATAYADVSYRSAYLKAHWPAEFLCARLADAGGFHHPAIYIAEAVRLGIEVRPPHVNYSGNRFTLTYEPSDDGPTPILWMGLNQVRDLRRETVKSIIAGRAARAFTGVGDLMERVKLQPKETANLIRCGALDGLGFARSAMLAEADLAGLAGSARQMTFGFAASPAAIADSVIDRLAWERQILGQPVSAHPLDAVEPSERYVTLSRLPESAGTRVVTLGVRLPGWTGGQGFFLGDRTDFVIARIDKASPAAQLKRTVWQPLLVAGRWRRDEWDGGWFQVETIEPLPVKEGA